MIYIPEIKERIEELFPRFLQKQLCKEEIQELHTLIDDVVRESRETRSTSVDSDNRPENFLIVLFQPLIKVAVTKFFDRYAEHLSTSALVESRISNIEREDTSIYRDWTHYATIITRTLILGDSTEREDRREEIQPFLDSFIRCEDRQLFLSNRTARARLQECLRQVVKDHEFFVNPRPWAEQCATSEESKCYNPDYNKEKKEDLELQKEEANNIIERWENGEFRDSFNTRSELVEYINSYYIDTSLEELDNRIAETDKRTHLVGYLFGNKVKNGYLYWRLKDLLRYQIKISKKYTSKEIEDEGRKKKESPLDTSIESPADILDILDTLDMLDMSPLDILIAKEGREPNELQEDEELSVDNSGSIKKLSPFGFTEKQLEVYVLHNVNKLSYRDIASRMDMSHQNAHRLYHKALHRILSKIPSDLTEEQSEIVRFYLLEGLSFQAISNRMNMSPENVRDLYSEIMKKIPDKPA